MKLNRCPSPIFGRPNPGSPQIFGELFLLVLLLTRFEAGAGSLQFAGAPAELVISEVSERTLRVTLSPLDEHGRARLAPQSAVLTPEKRKED